MGWSPTRSTTPAAWSSTPPETSTPPIQPSSISYNGLGEVSKRIEANGDTTTYGYDVAGRLETEIRAAYLSDAEGWVSPQLTYRYDALGNLVRTEQAATKADGAVRVTRSFHGAGGRLARTINAADETTEYYYDAAGNVVRQSYVRRAADGPSSVDGLLITRDALGRVKSQALGTLASGVWTWAGRRPAVRVHPPWRGRAPGRQWRLAGGVRL